MGHKIVASADHECVICGMQPKLIVCEACYNKISGELRDLKNQKNG